MSPNGRILATLRRRQSRLEDKVGLINPFSVNTDQGNATTLAVADDRVRAHLGDNKIVKLTDCV